MAAQAVFDTPDLRRLIFQLRLREFYASLVKWRNKAMEELGGVERAEWATRGKLWQKQARAKKALLQARASDDGRGLYSPSGGVFSVHVREPFLVHEMQKIKSELEAQEYRVQQLAEARRALSDPACPRHDATDVVRMRRKLLFLSRPQLSQLRRGVDAVLRGKILHAEFVQAVGRPPKRRFRNPPGTPWSQTDIRSFAPPEGGTPP